MYQTCCRNVAATLQQESSATTFLFLERCRNKNVAAELIWWDVAATLQQRCSRAHLHTKMGRCGNVPGTLQQRCRNMLQEAYFFLLGDHHCQPTSMVVDHGRPSMLCSIHTPSAWYTPLGFRNGWSININGGYHVFVNSLYPFISRFVILILHNTYCLSAATYLNLNLNLIYTTTSNF